jgi:enamine deaminase RidA (YjgF/YER057c/UK114 family)
MQEDVAGEETGATQMLQGRLRISIEKSSVVNEIYARSFPKNPPASIFVNVPAWRGHFDIEIDCIAAL